ncbi:CRISPR-associated CARF protein Csx1 [Sulfurisphaera javensis]|uniref:CRISPR-associated CARF protein Csx1 n=1 Tax=Sulfurisphaera javensis TaxID=2049879 RepID=A0AAT9GVC4_9CREN
MPIYISTWGDPTGWREAKYVCGEEKKGFLSAVCYKDVSKLIVITLDSILTPRVNENSNVVKCLPTSLPSDYESWKKKIEEYVNCILKNIDLQADVIVLPAIGKYGNYEYGRVEDRYIPTEFIRGILTLELYKRLKDKEEVILDITHGVNYLGALTLYVLSRLTSFLSLKLKVINFIPTDPVNRVFTYTEVLSYSKQYFDYNSVDETKILDKKKRATVLSLKYNALLPLYNLCKENKIPDYTLSVRIENNVLLISSDVKNLSYLSEDNVWGEIIYDYVCSKVKPKKWVSTKELSHLTDEIFKIDAQKTLIYSELNNVYNLGKKKLKEGEEASYFSVYEKKERKENANSSIQSVEEESEDKLERNFMAHAGLIKDAVILKKESNMIYVSYDESKKDILKDLLGVDIFST